MSIQEPGWLKRTRPCPFFSQGRCLFADSCNFLHDVKVRSAVNQPLFGTIQVKQLSLPSKPVLAPPSVLVHSTSPRLVDQASPGDLADPVKDSSRYSGLLSVLSDVIGPPPNLTVASEDAVPRSRTAAASSSVEQSSVLDASECTLVDPVMAQMEPALLEVVGSLAAEFQPVPDDGESPDRDTESYIVEDLAIDKENDDKEDMGDYGEEDSTVVLSNRQSTFSSFTGASLLASPRNSVFGEASVVNPIGDGTADLLSPVQLSVKLRPFSIPSLSSKAKRGDSIDSGYADGDCWVGPHPFPHSPPDRFQSPVTLLYHSRQTSHLSPALEHRRVSYDVRALRPSLHYPIEAIKEEVEFNGSSEDSEDVAHAILGAYDMSPSQEQGEDEACDTFQVNLAEEKTKDDELPARLRSPRRHSPDRLRAPREHGLDSCNQPSFVSDDNLSFKTALSTQPSHDDLNNVPRLSPAKQDSLLSYISGCSTPSTSALSHYGDANESLEQPNTVGLHACESSCPVATSSIADAKVSEAGDLEYLRLQHVAIVDPDVLLASASVADLQGLAPDNVVALQRPQSGVFHIGRRSPTSIPLVVEPSSSANGTPGHVSLSADGIRGFAPEKVTPREGSSTAFGSDIHPPQSGPSAEIHGSPPSLKDTFYSSPPGVDVHQKSAPKDVSALQECSPWILHYDRCSPKLSPSTEGSYGPSSYEDAFDHVSTVAGNVREFASRNVVTTQKDFSDALCLGEHPLKPSPSTESPRGSFSVKDVLGYPSHYEDGKLPADDISPCDSSHFDKHLPKSSPSAESPRSPSLVKDVHGYALLGAHSSDSKSPGPSPSVPSDYPVEYASAEAGQSLIAENALGPDEVAQTFVAERGSFVQRLSFPLPPFLPAKSVGHFTLGGGEVEPVLSEPVSLSLEESISTVSNHEAMQRIRSGSDLTEKARSDRLSSVRSPDFVLRRSRAASDITLKGKSPPGDPYVSRSPQMALEQPDQSDSVQSLYDEYLDDGTAEDGSCPPYKTTLPNVPASIEQPSQEIHAQLDLASHIFQKDSYPCSDAKPATSDTDSLRSETVLRPLLTGRLSFLPSPLTELVPKADLTVRTHPSTRFQVKEIGSTIVPLGFRRHKPQPATSAQPLHKVLPASELREVLRIRTDIVREDIPPRCPSASQASFPPRPHLPAQSMSAPPTSGLKELCLSSIVNKRSSILSTHSSSIASSILSYHIFNSSSPQSPSVSSTTSFSHNSLLSPSSEQIPAQTHHTPKRSNSPSPIEQATGDVCLVSQSSTRCDSRSASEPTQQPRSWRLSHYRAGSRNYTSADGSRRLSRRSSTLSLSFVVDEQPEIDEGDSATSHSTQSQHARDWTRATSVLPPPAHAIATPKPTLLFAIASDDVDQVRQVLESGEAGPNDPVGPQSALAFTLTNDKLAHKQEIIKALLAYGANPSTLQNPALNPSPRIGGNEPSVPPPETTLEGMDPATRYFVARADAVHTRQTSQLIHRSFFRPLTRVQYDVIGQDWALEQLFRVLGMHSRKLSVSPIVVLLCGPSGHGKSLLARKFGSLLDVPTHTVNMTTLRSTHDIWQSYSMSPYEEPSSCTLAEFLIENEEKRCVVVLDEIEKVEDQKALWSLLMPWELGRCPLEVGKRHVDARNVIWLGTSNIGHELVFGHHENRTEQDKRMSREEYLELTSMLRPRVSDCLGASLVSRVTTVLPFVPFTLDEKKAIAAEAIYALAGDAAKMLSPQDVESLVMKALPNYHPGEGARSLHRAISNILVDAI